MPESTEPFETEAVGGAEVSADLLTDRHAAIAEVRAVAVLLDNVTVNRYECQEAWEEFPLQAEALSDALMARVQELEAVVVGRSAPRVASMSAARHGNTVDTTPCGPVDTTVGQA